MKKYIALLGIAIMPAFSKAEISLPEIIGDNMVLQQNSDALLWGWATPGETISVTPSWSNKTYTAKADKKGRFDVRVATPAASFTPYSIKVSGDGSNIDVNNVLIGEVWLCSGQSNMEMPLRGYWTQPVEDAAQAIAYSGKYPGIRMVTIPKSEAKTPQERTPGKWMLNNPANSPEFSALAYFFARSLSDILDVPVGIISCAYGGAKLESWMPEEIVATYSDIDVKAEINGTAKVDDWHRAVVRYNSMLNPIVGYTIKGFLWNQGESNVGKHDTYPERINMMVEHWRERWGNDSLPFYQVELPGWNYGNPEATDAALFRECQHKAAEMMKHGGIVCTSDLVYPYELEDIHASQKQPIGERMAFLAAANDYGYPTIAHVYPKLTDYKIEGDKAILRFDNVEGFLTPNDNLDGFEVAGEDQVFYPATATFTTDDKHDLIVTSDKVNDIKSIRYCFKNFAIGNVHSMLGLPLIPFRTDNWDK